MGTSGPPGNQDSSWRESIELSWIALKAVFPYLAAIFVTIQLAVLFFVLLALYPPLALVPAAVIALALFAVVRIDRRRRRVDVPSIDRREPPQRW